MASKEGGVLFSPAREPRRASRALSILSLLAGLIGAAAILAAIWIGNYGVRRFEMAAGYTRASLLSWMGPLFAGGLLLSLFAVVAGHVARRRIRRETGERRGAAAAAGLLFGYLTFFGNYFFWSNHPTDWPPLIGTGEDHAIAALQIFNFALSQYRAASSTHSFPQSVQELDEETLKWYGHLFGSNAPDYRLAYTPATPDRLGRIQSYELRARPRRFPETGRASFFMDQSAVVRWAPEDRDATANDPPIGRRTRAPGTEPWKGPEPEGEELMAPQWVAQIARCSVMYSIVHPQRGYAPSLEAMGPDGEKCVFGELATGAQRGYRYSYTADSPDEGGRITSFQIEARPEAYDFTGRWSWLGDESGQVRGTRDDRPARLDDPVKKRFALAEEILRANEIGVLTNIPELHNCLALYAEQHPATGFPAKLEMLGSIPGKEYCARLMSRGESCYAYNYVAGAKNASGRITSYTLTVRPVTYGVTGRSSFLSDDSKDIHYTSEDRAATLEDPYFGRKGARPR